MSTPLWISETADGFWANAGRQQSFPRDLRVAIALALPLTVVLLPRLRVSSVDTWLHEQGIPCGLNMRDRRLRACLVARYGQGLIFMDGADSEDEQRFSIAHELAHFLRDYWQPRELASKRLGLGVLEVLDGERPPRQDERVHAVLAAVHMGVLVHLMERTEDGHPARTEIETCEREADHLAFEVLAPAAMVMQDLTRVPFDERYEIVLHLLKRKFGLPAAPAAQYAMLLVPPPPHHDSLLRRLRLLP